MVAWLCGCSKVNESANGAVNFTRLFFLDLNTCKKEFNCSAMQLLVVPPNVLCEMPTRLPFIRFPVLRLVAELALVSENKTPDGSDCFVSKDKGTKKHHLQRVK
jgi:hypothetical protein